MNALYLFSRCARGERPLILRTLLIEWLHNALAAAPNGLIIWLVWQLVINNQVDQDFWLLLALMAALFGIQMLIAPRAISTTSNLSYRLSCKLRLVLAEHASQLGLGVYGGQQLGAFADTLNQSINRFEFVLSHSLTNLLAAISTPVLLLLLLSWLDWRLSLIMLSSILVTVVCQHCIGIWLARGEAAAKQHSNTLRSQLLNMLAMLPVLKCYGSSHYWQSKYTRLANKASLQQLKLHTTIQPLAQMSFLLLDIGFVLTLWLGVALCMGSSLQLVNLLLFALIGYRVFEPVKILLTDWLLLRQADDELATATGLLRHTPLKVTAGDNRIRDFSLSCHGLVFAYEQGKEPVLQCLSAEFPQGSTTALVGLSGAGKTTLLQLLMRFWDPQQGEIRIGGALLTRLAPEKIHSLYAPVFQQPYLFKDSLLNNVRFGKPDASENELKHALRASGCDRLAEDLPDGLHTNIGEEGRLLSGGQQQLIAIARCLLKNAPIVLFDEATAALDPENSALVYEAIERLGEGKTRIVIAHDLERIRHADQILLLDKGKITARGTHAQLLRSSQLYIHLWEKQHKARGWCIRTNKSATGSSDRSFHGAPQRT